MKKSIISAAQTVPQIRRYLEEKEAMRLKINQQQDEIKELKLKEEKAEYALKLSRGEIPNSVQVEWPVFEKDIFDAYSHDDKTTEHSTGLNPPYTINWVIPPMDAISGGHTDIFRTIAYLEKHGHTCRIYFYDALKRHSLEQLRSTLKNHYPQSSAEIFYNASAMKDCDAIFATNWFTAYPVKNFKGKAKKYYYVQDFEPYFDPVGSYSTLAENTYSFGLQGITLSKWLSEKLSQEYGMTCDYFEFGSDKSEYKFSNNKPRKEILFYARPVTQRRGFEIGLLALKIFHQKHPEYKINFLGWDVKQFKMPFPYVNNGILSPTELNTLYNRCAAGLVISFTNMSILPLELLACGCIPVVNDSHHTRLVGYSDLIKFAKPNPVSIAETLSATVQLPDLPKFAKDCSLKAGEFDWDKSNSKIEQILIRDLKG